jgi:hypothetical protein
MSSLDHERTLIVGYSQSPSVSRLKPSAEQAVTLKEHRQKHKRPRPTRVGRGQLALS